MTWKKKKIEDFAEVITGGTPSTSNSAYWESGDIPWLNSGELNQEIITYCSNYITGKGLKNSAAKVMPMNSVLIALTGATTGKTAFLTFDACANQSVTGILPSPSHHPKYLYYYLRSIRNKVLNDAYGGAQKHISQKYVKEIEVPLPPLHIQEQIADTLDKADALRRKDQELLQKYDELTQAIFHDMFGNPVRNERKWETTTIEQIAKKDRHSIKRGPFGGSLKKEIFAPSGFLVYEQFHALNNDFNFGRYFISSEKFHELNEFKVEEGDILISCSGVYLGKSAIVPKGAKQGIINQALLKISLDPNRYRNEFFLFVFTNKDFKQKYFPSNRGVAIPNFPPMHEFRKFEFIIPPISIQTEFVNRLKIIESAKSILLTYPDLFQSLMSRIF